MTKAMGKTELIAEVAKVAKIEKTKAKAAVDATIAVITTSLKKGGKVQITGFGTFQAQEAHGREPPDRGENHDPGAQGPEVYSGEELERPHQVVATHDWNAQGRPRPPLFL
jgi:nucleoid DNA-binding protein